METPQDTSASSQPDTQIAMGVLAYLGPLVIVSYLVAKDDPFVKFHIKQGLVLLVIDLILWAVSFSFWPLWMLWNLIDLALFVFVVIGIVNVVKKREQELPLIGGLAHYFTF